MQGLSNFFLDCALLFLVNLKLLVYKVFFGGAIRGVWFIKSRSFPSLRLRNGTLTLGKVKFRSHCQVFCDEGNVIINDGVFFNNNCSINSKGVVSIGDNTIFGESVKIYDHNHTLTDLKPDLNQFTVQNVSIGKNCWFGSNCIILAGVSICEGVTVGAGCVVSKDITEPGVYVSNCAKLRKVR